MRTAGRRVARLIVWLIAAVGLTASGGLAQTRETLETKVTGSGDIIQLKWGKKHPWDADLRGRGVSLMVEYATERVGVAIDCLRSLPGELRGTQGVPSQRTDGGCGVAGIKVADDERALRFPLPNRVTAAPKGNVCLYFQLPDRRVLPLRRADDQGRETARFSYPAWSLPVSRGAASAAIEGRRESLRQAIDIKRQDIQRQEAINQRNQWSEPGCGQIQAPRLSQAGAQVRPLAEPKDREAVARQICVMRIANADDEAARYLATGSFKSDKRLLPLLTGYVHGPATLDYVLSLLPAEMAGDAVVVERRAQAETFRRDYSGYAPHIRGYIQGIRNANYPKPHFGEFDDRLAMQTLAKSGGKSLAQSVEAGTPIDGREALGYVGAMLEAQSRCMNDGKAQLETTYTAFHSLKARTPQLEEASRQQLVRACNSGVAKLAQLKEELAALEQDLVKAEAAVAESTKESSPPSSERTELNAAACAP